MSDDFEEEIDDQEQDDSSLIDDVNDIKNDTKDLNKKISDYKSKETSKQATSQAGKEAGKNATKETGKQVAKEASKETGKQVAKDAGKQVAKEAGKQVAKEGAKQGAKAAVVGGASAAGEALAGPVGWVILAAQILVKAIKVRNKLDKKIKNETGVDTKGIRRLIRLSPLLVIIAIVLLVVLLFSSLMQASAHSGTARLTDYIKCAEAAECKDIQGITDSGVVPTARNKSLIKFTDKELKSLSKSYAKYINKYYDGTETIDTSFVDLSSISDVEGEDSETEKDLGWKKIYSYLKLGKDLFNEINWKMANGSKPKMDSSAGNTGLNIPSESKYGKDVDYYISLVSSYLSTWIEPYSLYTSTSDKKLADNYMQCVKDHFDVTVTVYELVETVDTYTKTTTTVSTSTNQKNNYIKFFVTNTKIGQKVENIVDVKLKSLEDIENNKDSLEEYSYYDNTFYDIVSDYNFDNEYDYDSDTDVDENTDKQKTVTYIPVVTKGYAFKNIYKASYKVTTTTTYDYPDTPMKKTTEPEVKSTKNQIIANKKITQSTHGTVTATKMAKLTRNYTKTINEVTRVYVYTKVTTKTDELKSVSSKSENYENDEKEDIDNRFRYYFYLLQKEGKTKYALEDIAYALEQVEASFQNLYTGAGSSIDYSSLPATAFGWPVPSTDKVAYLFGYTIAYGESHGGIDIHAVGDMSIVAARAGKVIMAVDGCVDGGNKSCGGGYGNHVYIDHGDGYVTRYAHMQQGTVAVATGATVTAGQLVGIEGTSGSSTGKHLHFEVLYNGNRIDPLNFYVVELTESGRADGAPTVYTPRFSHECISSIPI